jgi:hypothetical protein
MKQLKAFVLFVLLQMNSISGQTPLENFSDISFRPSISSHMVNTGESIVVGVQWFTGNGYNYWLYKLNLDGVVTDSLSLNDGERIFFGKPVVTNGQLYFAGAYQELNTPTIIQRYAILRLSDDLEIMDEFASPPFGNGKGFYSLSASAGNGIFNRTHEFQVLNDTIYGLGRYIIVDSVGGILGTQNYYFLANMNGEFYKDAPVEGFLFNPFYRGNKVYFMGSASDPDNPFLPKAVGMYDKEGVWIKGWDFDNSGSGEFPWGAVGGAIDDRLYFSYLGRDNALAGCSQNNVAVDVRDLDFNVIKRFKIPECGFQFSGNFPFTKGIDGSIYFMAVSDDYKRMIVKKYTPEMAELWSAAYDFSQEDYVIAPVEITSLADSSLVIHAYEVLNGSQKIRLFKVTDNGIISSIGAIQPPFGQQAQKDFLYPNPCRETVFLSDEIEQPIVAEFYGANGNMTATTIFDTKAKDISFLPTGTYFVVFKNPTDNKVINVQSLIKVR